MSSTTTTETRTPVRIRGGVGIRQWNTTLRADYRPGGRGDLYDRNMCVKWTLNMFIALYIVGFAAYGVLIVNINERHDWFATPGAPCSELVSTRYNNVTYWAIAFSCFRVFFMVAMLGIIGFKRVIGCTTAWVVVMFVATFIDAFVWIILLSNVVGANDPLRPTICDDLLKCNVREFYENPRPNWCTNTELTPRDIDLTIDELEINDDCKWLFGANTAWLFIMDGVLLGMTMIIWVGYTNWEQLERVAKTTQHSWLGRQAMNVVARIRHRAQRPQGAKSKLGEYRIPMPATVNPSGPSPKSGSKTTAGGESKRRAAGLRSADDVESSKNK